MWKLSLVGEGLGLAHDAEHLDVADEHDDAGAVVPGDRDEQPELTVVGDVPHAGAGRAVPHPVNDEGRHPHQDQEQPGKMQSGIFDIQCANTSSLEK